MSESFLLKAVGLLLALILWVTILGFKHEELKKQVKLEPLLPPGMVITSKVPKSILFTFSGPRVLLKDLERKLEPMRPDLRRSRDTTIVYSSEDLLGELPNGIRVVGYYPPNVLIRLEEIVEKRVKVKPTLTGNPPASYQIASIAIIPAEVEVLGPRSLMDSLTDVATAPIDVTGLVSDKEADVEVSLDSDQGVQTTATIVHVKIRVKRIP